MEELQTQDIPVVILLGTAGMLLLIGGMGLFILQYQKRLLRDKQLQTKRELEYQNQMIQLQLDSQEKERKRISADLHDSLGSLLWGAKVNASFIQRSCEITGEALNSYNELVHILDDSINIVRRISWELSPDAFHHAGLSESVKKLCNQLNGKGIDIKLSEEGKGVWNNQEALQAFRIVQELLSNACKHSQASSISVILTWLPTALNIQVSDDGVGFSSAIVRKGVGLWNIEQRVKQLGAQIHMGNSPMGKGTNVAIKIPLNNE